MATFSGVTEYKICNGYITLSVEWRVEQDILNSTNTYYYDIYVDTSKCTSAKYEGTGIIDLRGSKIPDITFKINGYELSRFDKVGKNKIGSCHTEAQAVGEEATSFSINLGHTGYFYAYTDLTTYVKDNIKDNSYRWYTVNGITRTTAGDVYGDFILGNEHTLNLTRVRDEFTHKVEYYCGNTSKLLLLNNSKVETINFAPPVEWSSQNTTGTTVNVTFDVTTYYDGTPIGTKTKTVTFTMPESVKPSCSFVVTDGTLRDGQQIKDIYGGYVREKSRFKIVVSAVEKYGSPIAKYTINANGKVFDEQTTITNLLKTAGENRITVTVTDKRGRTSEEQIELVNVLPYNNPVVTAVSAFRYAQNESGEWVQDRDGEYIKVFFSAEVTPIDGKNSAKYFVSHQMSSGLEPSTNHVAEYDDIYAVENGEYIFEARVGVDYTVTVHAEDDFGQSLPKSSGGVATTILMHLLANGLGLCFGGLGSIDNCFENKFLTYPSGGFMFPRLEAGAKLHPASEVPSPNIYICENAEDYDFAPNGVTGTFVLFVLPYGTIDDFLYIIISTEPKIYMRTLIDSSLGSWRSL